MGTVTVSQDLLDSNNHLLAAKNDLIQALKEKDDINKIALAKANEVVEAHKIARDTALKLAEKNENMAGEVAAKVAESLSRFTSTFLQPKPKPRRSISAEALQQMGDENLKKQLNKLVMWQINYLVAQVPPSRKKLNKSGKIDHIVKYRARLDYSWIAGNMAQRATGTVPHDMNREEQDIDGAVIVEAEDVQ